MHSEAFDVIPFEVSLMVQLANLRPLTAAAHFWLQRISKGIGRNWARVRSVTFTKVDPILY